jgi:hypothetical protein
MAVLLNLASRSYPVAASAFNVNVAANATLFFVSLTRENWSEGLVLSIDVDWPDGSSLEVTMNGGVQFDQGPTVGTTITRAKSDFTVTKKPGITSAVLTVNVLKTLKTAIQVVST